MPHRCGEVFTDCMSSKNAAYICGNNWTVLSVPHIIPCHHGAVVGSVQMEV